jgi:two-component system NarL family sensor kinase
VRLETTPDTVTLTIRDDGVGLPAERDGGGLGLRSMAERALELDGECDVSAGPDGGTTVRVSIPLRVPR